MNEEIYWQQFTNSGRIQDYLSYTTKRQQTNNEPGRQPESEGDYPYAGFCYGNGNDFKPDACR